MAVGQGTQVHVKMPQVGTSISEGTVAVWHKSVGDRVERGELLMEISNDKIDTEVEAEAAGVLSEILVEAGQTVGVGTDLAVITVDGDGGGDIAGDGQAATSKVPGDQAATETGMADVTEADAALVASEEEIHGHEFRVDSAQIAGGNGSSGGDGGAPRGTPTAAGRISPRVARMAAEHGIDLSRVQGTGAGGRITKKDVEAFLAGGGAADGGAAAAPQAPAAPAQAAAGRVAPVAQPVASAAGEEIIKLSRMRQVIARGMLASRQTSAHVTTWVEVDMTAIAKARSSMKEEYARRGAKLTFLPFIAEAAVGAMPAHPFVNATLDMDRGEVTVKHYVNLGIAVSLGQDGLIVPVVHGAEQLNLFGLAKGIADVAQRARTKKLTGDDLEGGTFTITNQGSAGTIISTPIINQPQVAILDVEAIVKRPVVISDPLEGDRIAIRQMMFLGLSFDHRLIDGAVAGEYLGEVRRRLESWTPPTT
jgi:2-oxoglutarate dehydrogenase E2 component (dihydrolipoamide succinyltransferase)